MNALSQSSAPLTGNTLVESAVATYERPLIQYAYSLLKDADKARDVVQETFVKLCQQDADTLRERLKPWLYTVCRHGALDILRKERRMIAIDTSTLDEMGSDAPDPSQEADRNDSHGRALALLERLSDNQREVIRLRFQSQLSYREISEITDLTESNVGFLLHTGLKQLRTLMNA